MSGVAIPEQVAPGVLLQAAQAAQAAKAWADAIDHWRAFLAAYPVHPAAASSQAQLATALERCERWPEAETAWAGLLDGAQSRRALVGWARTIFKQEGATARAKAAVELVRHTLPDEVFGLTAEAQIATHEGRPADAARLWAACLDQHPDHPMSRRWRLSLGRALSASNRHAEAEAVLSALADTADPDAEVLAGLAQGILKREGASTRAEQAFERLLAIFPDHPAGCSNYARLAEQRGDHRLALDRWRTFIRHQPMTVAAYRGAVAAAAADRDHAAAHDLVASAPDALASTPAFQCQVVLGLSRLEGDRRRGVDVVANLDPATLTEPDLGAIADFLKWGNRFDLLDRVLSVALPSFPASVAVQGMYLNTLVSSGQEERFTREKGRLLGGLQSHDRRRLLERLPTARLSLAEVEVLIDAAVAAGEGADAAKLLADCAFSTDPELIAYVAAFARHETDPVIAPIVRLAGTKARDMAALHAADRTPTHWSEFEHAARRLRRDVQALVEDGEPGPMIWPVANDLLAMENLATASWVYSAESYADAAAFCVWLLERIDAKTPTSVIRLGDGEGVFLPYHDEAAPHLHGDRRRMQATWWGHELSEVEQEALSGALQGAVRRADAVGTPPVVRLAATLGSDTACVGTAQRGLLAASRFARTVFEDEDVPKALVSAHLHTDLNTWDLFRIILRSGSSVSVISCHDLRAVLDERFGTTVRAWHAIPGEARYRGMFGQDDIPEVPFYPAIFETLMETIAPEPGELHLVAAGFLGKLLCDRIRERGGVAFDIGSAADYWSGFATRRQPPGTIRFDPARSLIEDHPFEGLPAA